MGKQTGDFQILRILALAMIHWGAYESVSNGILNVAERSKWA